MFKTNPDDMRMEPTPERVLAVCRLIARKSITRDEVQKAMTLGHDDDKAIDQINKSIAVALDELAILKKKDDHLILAVDPEVIQSPVNFRRYVSSRVFAQKNTTFSMFTRWLIAKNEGIFPLGKWEGLAKTCGAEVSELSALNENAVLGWRFWAAFLGIGYLSGTMIIPNMKIRLQDILAVNFPEKYSFNTAISAVDFITWLSNKIPEADMTDRLPLAVSAGLRTLHELGLIKLETWRDSNRVMLYYVDGDPFNDFSHITVKEEISK